MIRRHASILGLTVLAFVSLLPPAALAQGTSGKGHSYAFLVACSDYNKNELKPLPFTINDIEEFRKVLLESGFEADSITMLHDRQTDRLLLSEKAKILKALRLQLNGLNPEDTLVVALSGHGVHFKGDKVGYFCPVDAKLGDRTTLMPMDGEGGLFELLKACKARRKLLLVNACRNDPAGGLAQAAKKVNLDDEDKDEVPEGIAALYSCQEGDKSYYDPDRKMGLFFYHLCNAWRGDYQDEARPLTVEDLFEQVTRETKKDADRNFGAPQVPVTKRAYAGEWKLDQGNTAVRAALRKGKLLLEKYEYGEAKAALSEAVQLNPREARAYCWRGLARTYREEYDEALADAKEAVKLAPQEALGHAVLAGAHNGRKEYDLAITASDRAIQLDSKLALAFNARGWAYSGKKEYDRAIEDCTTAIKLDSKLALAYYSRASAYILKKEYDQGIEDCTMASKLNPKFALAYNNRGYAYFLKQKYDRTIEDCTTAIKHDPKCARAYWNRAAAYQALGQMAQAEEDSQKARELEK